MIAAPSDRQTEYLRLLSRVTRFLRQERKRLQIEHAPALSGRAKLVKLGDKISNVRDVTHTPPDDWSPERRLTYLRWTQRVVAGCRGTHAELEELYDAVLAEGLARLDQG